MTENEGQLATATPPKPTSSPAKSKGTHYVVLRDVGHGTWKEVPGPDELHQSAEQAQRRAAEAIGFDGQEEHVRVVAVPARSWSPLTFRRKVRETLEVQKG